MKILCEVRWIKEGTEDDEEPQYERGMYVFWHWGLKYDIITDKDGNGIPVSYTVAICESCDTGQVECFLPDQLIMKGDKIRK